ncbi:hypothetical protein [Kitasatospora purpeofusca]|uniref:hypothetical protein n=1 Tax=Kitasatospora purpeofusca TaxID=67352 RepID=UPI002A5A2CDD|nr:hypothetical protein [Kitasatospora purpeofusca]MDY0816314.1 hypothetical protein [Kitasatospora purpeofusca]
MNRLTTAALAGAAGLAALTVGLAPTATAATTTGPAGPTGTVTCGTPGAPGFLLTRACIEVSGTHVRLYGQVATTDPAWVAQNVGFTIAGSTPALPPQPPLNLTVLVPPGGASVGDLLLNVPCGNNVTANFSVNNGGWPPSTATVTAFVPC